MKIVASIVSALALATPVLAQPPQSGWPDCGPMAGGWTHGMMFHPFLGFLFFLLLLGLVAAVILPHRFGRCRRGGCPYCGHGRGDALSILEERFARGEIDKAEFEDRRKALGR